jgi:hypothetical protein
MLLLLTFLFTHLMFFYFYDEMIDTCTRFVNLTKKSTYISTPLGAHARTEKFMSIYRATCLMNISDEARSGRHILGC